MKKSQHMIRFLSQSLIFVLSLNCFSGSANDGISMKPSFQEYQIFQLNQPIEDYQYLVIHGDSEQGVRAELINNLVQDSRVKQRTVFRQESDFVVDHKSNPVSFGNSGASVPGPYFTSFQHEDLGQSSDSKFSKLLIPTDDSSHVLLDGKVISVARLRAIAPDEKVFLLRHPIHGRSRYVTLSPGFENGSEKLHFRTSLIEIAHPANESLPQIEMGLNTPFIVNRRGHAVRFAGGEAPSSQPPYFKGMFSAGDD